MLLYLVVLQLPGSAHDTAVQGYGFRYDYIDPQFPTAAKVRQHVLPGLAPGAGQTTFAEVPMGMRCTALQLGADSPAVLHGCRRWHRASVVLCGDGCCALLSR